MNALATSLMLLCPVLSVAQEPKPTTPPATAEEKKLDAEIARLINGALQSFKQGRSDEGVVQMRQFVEASRKRYPKSKHPNGHTELADAVSMLGNAMEKAGRPNEAEPIYLEALSMRQELASRSGRQKELEDVVASFNDLGDVCLATQRLEAALKHYRKALELRESLYPKSKFPVGTLRLAVSHRNLGVAYYQSSRWIEALRHNEAAVAMVRAERGRNASPSIDANLSMILKDIASIQYSLGTPERALPLMEESLNLDRAQYPKSAHPNGHERLARSLRLLGELHEDLGQHSEALHYYEQALSMDRGLYPKDRFPRGHASLSKSLSSVGGVLLRLQQPPKALPYVEEALAMDRLLYPKEAHPTGHVNIANTLVQVGGIQNALGQREKALTSFKEALGMCEKLFPVSTHPRGDASLATCHSSIGFTLKSMGKADEAVPHFVRAYEIDRANFPENEFPLGSRELASGLNNLGAVLHAAGRSEEALTNLRRSFAMSTRLLERQIAVSAERDMFDQIQALPLTRDGLLTVALGVQGSDASVYESIWKSRGMITRLLQRRRIDAFAAGSGQAAALKRVREHRLEIDRLLKVPSSHAERDQQLHVHQREVNRIERELGSAAPAMKQWSDLDSMSVADLSKCLGEERAFIDFIQYMRFEDDPTRQAQEGLLRIPHYAAFVVASGRPPIRIELGPSATIDTSVAAWRTAVASRRDSGSEAQSVSQLVWSKIAPHLAAGTKAVFLSPDGSLSGLPWAALPVGNDRVLIERCAVSVVPHGWFLLENLAFPKDLRGAPTVLAVGGLDYRGTRPQLAGTKAEIDALTEMAPGGISVVCRTNASAALLASDLRNARYAHFATHGEFRADEYRNEKRLELEARRTWVEGRDVRRVAAKNPMGYVGLVLSNGEVLSGLSIVDLPLENLRLATLSACESGLGELAGGEGVQGLQRAFHLAGCPNVVASLWKVADVPTLVLMEEFYGRLWRKENPLPPIEALREAQLAVMRNPKKVLERLGSMRAELSKRGLSEAELETRGFGRDLTKLPGRGVVEETTRSPTQWWAGFVISGVGG